MPAGSVFNEKVQRAENAARARDWVTLNTATEDLMDVVERVDDDAVLDGAISGLLRMSRICLLNMLSEASQRHGRIAVVVTVRLATNVASFLGWDGTGTLADFQRAHPQHFDTVESLVSIGFNVMEWTEGDLQHTTEFLTGRNRDERLTVLMFVDSWLACPGQELPTSLQRTIAGLDCRDDETARHYQLMILRVSAGS